MRELTQNVRAAAAALQEAIEAAVAAGYRVDWPAQAADLSRIAISETGRVQAAVAPVPTPTSDVVIDVVRPPAVIEMPNEAADPPSGRGGRRNRT